MTLGTVILATGEGVWKEGNYSSYLKELAYHELGHTLQSFILGPLYWLCIAPESFVYYRWHKWLHKDFVASIYYQFYTEKWANILGDSIFKLEQGDNEEKRG